MEIVHTLGFGLCHTGAGPAGFGMVSGGVAGFQGLESGSTSGTYFPVQGLWASDCRQVLTYGSMRGLFLLVAVCVTWCLFPHLKAMIPASCFFMRGPVGDTGLGWIRRAGLRNCTHMF